jgi:membrane protein
VQVWLGGTGLKFLAVAGGALLTCAFFAVLYLLVPETKVRLGAALWAGLVAGLSWEAAKWLYAIAVSRFFRYHAIYGSVAVIPTFLLWLEVSWTILLVGARITSVLQHVPGLRAAAGGRGAATRESLAGRLLVVVGVAWDGEGASAPATAAPDPSALAATLGAPLAQVSELVEALARAGLLRSEAGGGLVPGRSLERITLADVRHALAPAGARAGPPAPSPSPAPPGGAPTDAAETGPVDQALAAAEAEASKRLAETTLRRLCDEARRRSGQAPVQQNRPQGGVPEDGAPTPG